MRTKTPPKFRMQRARRYKVGTGIFLRRIPSVDGWDDVEFEAYNWPSLEKVTVRLSSQEMDALARFWLQRRISDEGETTR